MGSLRILLCSALCGLAHSLWGGSRWEVCLKVRREVGFTENEQMGIEELLSSPTPASDLQIRTCAQTPMFYIPFMSHPLLQGSVLST